MVSKTLQKFSKYHHSDHYQQLHLIEQRQKAFPVVVNTIPYRFVRDFLI